MPTAGVAYELGGDSLGGLLGLLPCGAIVLLLPAVVALVAPDLLTMLRCRSRMGRSAGPGAISRIPSLASRRASKTALAVSITDFDGTQP